MIFYDFEVFKFDWLAVFIDMEKEEKHVIINDKDALTKLYEENRHRIWIGYNNRHYDQYIMKGIILGMNPKAINDAIIVNHMEGWQFSRAFNTLPMINYDVMPNPPVGLKTMESFMGADIRETEVPFNIDRKLNKKEIEQTVYYCTHDVEQTIQVFLHTEDVYEAMKGIVLAFPEQVDLSDIGSSEARITAKVLGCVRHDYHDEFDFEFEPCLRLKKYKFVQDWFAEKRQEALDLHLVDADKYVKKQWYKETFLDAVVAGIPHRFGLGGLHGASAEAVHYDESDGAGYHVDVNNYYPSYLIAHNRTTRSATNDNYTLVYDTRKEMKMKQLAAKDKAEAKMWKKMQLPYKKMLNALSGAMKDATNAAYDPKMNNTMCINGQLMLLDLIEHLEVIPDFRLVQSNTDGLIVWIPNTDEAFQMLDDICYEWECRMSTPRCEIGLALDCIKEIYQKDVNNYLWVDIDGDIETKGSYIKGLSPIDFDLPIVNKALVDFMSKKIPVQQTIMQCNDLIQFQKVVKLSDKYKYVAHEEGRYIEHRSGKRVIKINYEYPDTKDYTYKCYRVFASNDMSDGRLLKVGGSRGKPEKFGSTPDHCFIFNDRTDGRDIPEKLDRQWYIDLALKRLSDYGIKDAGKAA